MPSYHECYHVYSPLACSEHFFSLPRRLSDCGCYGIGLVCGWCGCQEMPLDWGAAARLDDVAALKAVASPRRRASYRSPKTPARWRAPARTLPDVTFFRIGGIPVFKGKT